MKYSIRPLEAMDAEDFAALRRIPQIYDTLLSIPSESDGFWMDALGENDPDVHTFAAVTSPLAEEPRVIGVASLQVRGTPRRRHTGQVGVVVHPDWQNQGIGAALMERVIDLADNWLMLVRLELDVFPDNAPAVHLYEKLGFEKEGLMRCAATRQGKLADLLLMSRIRRWE